MAGGFWAADSIATGIEADIAARQHEAAMAAMIRDRDGYRTACENYKATIKELELANAANLAEKHALRVALAKFDPKHPLLVDEMLKKRVQDLGERAFSINQSYDDAARAGQKIKY